MILIKLIITITQLVNIKYSSHGRRYTRNELLERSTGETLNPLPYINYLKE